MHLLSVLPSAVTAGLNKPFCTPPPGDALPESPSPLADQVGRGTTEALPKCSSPLGGGPSAQAMITVLLFWLVVHDSPPVHLSSTPAVTLPARTAAVPHCWYSLLFAAGAGQMPVKFHADMPAQYAQCWQSPPGKLSMAVPGVLTGRFTSLAAHAWPHQPGSGLLQIW